MKQFILNRTRWLRGPWGTCAGHLLLMFSFAMLDGWLRFVTRWIGAYSIFELAPNLFTFLWAIMLTALVTIPNSRCAGRILYGTVYFLYMIYCMVQYGAYLVLGKFLYVSEMMLAGEGADYASWVLDLLTPAFLFQLLALAALGIAGIALYPSHKGPFRSRLVFRLSAVALCMILMIPVPRLYGDPDGTDSWDGFSNHALEYVRFTNANKDMELTGVYQYLFRDIQIQVGRTLKNDTEDVAMLDAYFADKEAHADNEMTGLFAGKNIIVVMMETMDDWMITPEDTPVLYYMTEHGIRFTNFYTPGYSSGYTFNTEFAFNTGVYPYSNGNTAYGLARNTYSRSLAGSFAAAGYAVNSYHTGRADYYNRGSMHTAWGYEQYHSYRDYDFTGVDYLDDRYLTECDALYNDLTSDAPFFSFVISYSPHLPYTDDDPLTRTALGLYPEYDTEENREVSILRAKARLTDDMFRSLLIRLEEDLLLEDTVIVGFGDHYAYGISDPAQLQSLSGNPILENTPAFIFCAGTDLLMEVKKTMQITDLAPTVMNLFGLDVPTEIMGRDIFDENYEGYAIFTNETWVTDKTYVKNGIVQWNHGMTDDEIQQMHAHVRQVYSVNDAILDTDYYAYR